MKNSIFFLKQNLRNEENHQKSGYNINIYNETIKQRVLHCATSQVLSTCMYIMLLHLKK